MSNSDILGHAILNTSIRFISLETDNIDQGINQALQQIGELLEVERGAVFRFSSDKSTLANTHIWNAGSVQADYSHIQNKPVDYVPWAKLILSKGDVLNLPRACEYVVSGCANQVSVPRSLIVIPMIFQGEMIGFIDFESLQVEREWAHEYNHYLHLLGNIFANAIKRKQSQLIQAGQQQFLELLATGADFSEMLHKLIQIIEEQWPGMLGLVLLLDKDGKHLHIGAAESLPQDYLDSIEGLEIGPNVGSCGTASFTKKRVIVEDILTDPRWDDLRDLAVKYGLAACWSEPILSSKSTVIGTFAMYYRHSRAPTVEELRTIEIGAHLAGVAIERKRVDEALQESQRTFATLISNLPGIAYRCQNNMDRTMEFVSEGSLELTGYRPNDFLNGGAVSYGSLIQNDDRAMVWKEVQAGLCENRPFQVSYRINSTSGEHWVWEQGQGVKDSTGKIIALEGFITDITERVMTRQNLEQMVDERTHELSTLLEISHNLVSMLDLEPLLDLILDQLKSVVEYNAASIMILNRDILKILAYRGPIAHEEALGIQFSVSEAKANQSVVQLREPLIVEDVRGDFMFAKAIRESARDELETTYNYLRCWMGVPLIVKDTVVGMLTLDHQQPGYYTLSHAELAMAFASHAAVAIENARLYQQAEQAAIAQERNRLARDLHDAVTQTLFSASLIAEVLPKLWERNPAIARQKLDELRVLTRGALSEMRTLLLELRPDTLADVDLGDLYQHLANAFTGRTRVPVAFSQQGQLVLPQEVKEAFYRVTQEALNNIIKHADASQVQISLIAQDNWAEVTIKDDGRGFDISTLSPENLGLKIMKERARAITANLTITSAPGAGTQIHLLWRRKQETL